MLTGRRVEGTIGLDRLTGKKDFNAFHRKTGSRLRDKLVKKLPWGWVKESQQRYKTFSSVPKDMPLDTILMHLESDHQEAMQAVVDADLIDRA
jgi:cytochrome b